MVVSRFLLLTPTPRCAPGGAEVVRSRQHPHIVEVLHAAIEDAELHHRLELLGRVEAPLPAHAIEGCPEELGLGGEEGGVGGLGRWHLQVIVQAVEGARPDVLLRVIVLGVRSIEADGEAEGLADGEAEGLAEPAAPSVITNLAS